MRRPFHRRSWRREGDSNILTCIIRPDVEENKSIAGAVLRLLDDSRFELCVPEVVDYELRRKLLHLGQHRHHARKWAQIALVLLDEFADVGYVPLTTDTMRLAADLWAKARGEGRLRGPEESLDVDVILAAQARQAKGHVVTTNERHFRGLAEVFDWRPYRQPWREFEFLRRELQFTPLELEFTVP